MARCAALFVLPLALFSACAIGEGVTPDCEPDVDGNGNLHNPKGCNPFAVCLKDQKDPRACCEDDKGTPDEKDDVAFTGCSLAECLYAFGEPVDLAKECGKGSGSSGSGSGGAGGGP